MWFGVLGPLLVHDGESLVDVPARRQRTLLAALLLRAGTVVPADALTELLWDGSPPAGAVTTLRSHVMRLRRSLGPAAGARVVTRDPGYLIETGEDEVDVLRFHRLCREGRTAVHAGDWRAAHRLLDEALSLWRGEPLADVPSELLRSDEVPRLEQLWQQAAEWRIEAALRLGCHADVVSELQRLTAQYSLRERFHAQLMLALVRCGRQAEALDAYQRARRVLHEELGAEPGAELRELHDRILTADPALAAPAPASAEPAPADPGQPVTPRELPAPVPHFTGRADELAALTGLLDRAAEAVLITAIGGTAGVGKTALAVHWAHRVANRFPDGQLYVNLRGYDPEQPVTAADALAGFLRSLGVPGEDIPAEDAERAARYRSLLSDRRLLVLLDNAGSVEQVRPLLPGSPACVAVVTSRDSLPGLVARDGAERLDLGLLSQSDALGLLRALIGDVRTGADWAAAPVLAEQCCRLPLALRLAAELAASRPAVPLAELTGELADQRQRLDLLAAGGDARTAVRAVFSWSYRQLDADAGRAFRLLGLHPGPDFDAYAAAALTGTTTEPARHVLGQLARAHLVQPARPGRYAMHDMLRAYARELAATQDGEDGQRAALTRLFDHYLHTAATAMDKLYPAEWQHRPAPPAAAGPARSLPGPAAAREWLDTERVCLIAAAAHAAGNGWPEHASALAATVFRHLEVTSRYPELVSMCGYALTAARRAGDRAAQARALHDATVADLIQGHFDQAANGLRQALSLYREVGDQLGEARALDHLGIASYLRGRYEQAARHYAAALDLYRQGGDGLGESRALNNLGLVELRLGRYEQAAGRFQQVLAGRVGDRPNEINSLANLGIIDLRQGRPKKAAARLGRALALSRKMHNPNAESYSLGNLALVDLTQGHHQQALTRLRRALLLDRRHGNRTNEVFTLNTQGEVTLAMGLADRARAQHRAALSLADRIGDQYEQARAHDGLARGYHAAGETALARQHWQEALTRYTGLGVPEAGAVRERLAGA